MCCALHFCQFQGFWYNAQANVEVSHSFFFLLLLNCSKLFMLQCSLDVTIFLTGTEAQAIYKCALSYLDLHLYS